MEKKIMIVDDAMFMRKLIRRNLEAEGYHKIVEASDGETALELFWREQPDLVILDITMAGMSGMKVLEEIMPKAPWAKVVMCSAVGQETMILDALSKGAADFIVKPFKNDEFIKIINNCIAEEGMI
ncbi:response regulator [Ruminococcus sp. OA3]|uniref:response regulator n=1 Tax=Ruminococcus sp. OA3 TaxID=2914164 RepID=UPI001F05542D|nr:response regulator [Ruminococcus sp. OA3]MCH1983018.1 response regulator [Ruminococcus sp. OA3]